MVVKNQTADKEFLLLGFGDLHDLKSLVFLLLLIIYVAALSGNTLLSWVLQVMVAKNQTEVTEFLLLGFGDLHDYKVLLFLLLLIIYVAALSGNTLLSWVLQVMVAKNQTEVTEFLLLGFGDLHDYKVLLFLLLLIIYVTSLFGNTLVIVLVIVSQNLHSPMYVFLTQLSLSEILFTGNIQPGMLWLILVGGGKLSITRCFSHYYLIAVCTITQCLLLITMSFDRYVAICQPLHYNMIMTLELQLQTVTSCWSTGFTLSTVLFGFLYSLEFCGPDTINHFYCEVASVLELSCSDVSAAKLVTSVLSTPLVVCPFVFILATYVTIFHTILKISSSIRRQKAFSTCSSHLTVVCLYFGSLASIYIFSPKISSSNTKKYLSLIYILVTPLFNPLIYSLKNQDIRGAITKYILNTWLMK